MTDPCPALLLVIVEWESATASGEDQHRGTDQLIADVSGRAGIPRPGSDASGLGKDVVAAIGDLAQLLNGFVEVAALGGVPHGGSVESGAEQLILGGHAQAYRMQIRLRQTIRTGCAPSQEAAVTYHRHSSSGVIDVGTA